MKDRIVYLIRHGKLQFADNQRRYIGQLDVPLNEEGLTQTRILGQRLKDADISAVYCSDLSRSRQTAEIIAASKQVEVIVYEQLREIYLGKWEGQTFAEVAKNYPRAYSDWGSDLAYYRVPGGESYADCGRRVVAAFRDILQRSKGNVLISGHIDVNRLLLCYILGLPIRKLYRIGQRHGCINVISCSNSGFRVELINSVVNR